MRVSARPIRVLLSNDGSKKDLLHRPISLAVPGQSILVIIPLEFAFRARCDALPDRAPAELYAGGTGL